MHMEQQSDAAARTGLRELRALNEDVSKAIQRSSRVHVAVVFTLIVVLVLMGATVTLAFQHGLRENARMVAQIDRLASVTAQNQRARLVHSCRTIAARPELARSNAQVLLRTERSTVNELIEWDNGELAALLSLCSGVELGQ